MNSKQLFFKSCFDIAHEGPHPMQGGDMIGNEKKEMAKNSTGKAYQTSGGDSIKLVKNKNAPLKDAGVVKGNLLKLKMFIEGINILDKEIGTLRGIFSKIVKLFKNIFSYMGSFLTRKKFDEIKAIFVFKGKY